MRAKEKEKQGLQLPGPSGPKAFQNFVEFLPLPNVAHLPVWGTLKVDKRVRSKQKISAIVRL